VSAVLFSNAGTLSKFTRMGVAAGFGPPEYKYYRIGFGYDADPNAVMGRPFKREVNDIDYQESWSDELQLFHNPNAKYPFDENAFGGFTQHFFKDGKPSSISVEGSPIASLTLIFRLGDEDKS
jgi:hypothetical protein